MFTISNNLTNTPQYINANKSNGNHNIYSHMHKKANLSFGANFTYDKLDKSKWYDTYIKYGNEKESEATEKL